MQLVENNKLDTDHDMIHAVLLIRIAVNEPLMLYGSIDWQFNKTSVCIHAYTYKPDNLLYEQDT